MLQHFRKRAKMTQEEAGFLLGRDARTIAAYESEEVPITPAMAVKMAEVYDAPELTAYFCRYQCDIGHRYCYDLLNNVDLNPIAILSKFADEKREIDSLLDGLLGVVINKTGPGDFSQEEMEFFENALSELCDIEHVIETLKIAAWRFLNVGQVIKEHNHKCVQRGYFKKEKAPVQAVLC